MTGKRPNRGKKGSAPKARAVGSGGGATLASVEATAALGLFLSTEPGGEAFPRDSHRDLTDLVNDELMNLEMAVTAPDAPSEDLTDHGLTTLMGLRVGPAGLESHPSARDLTDLDIARLMELESAPPQVEAEPPATDLTALDFESLADLDVGTGDEAVDRPQVGLTALELEQLVNLEVTPAATDAEAPESDLTEVELASLMNMEAGVATPDGDELEADGVNGVGGSLDDTIQLSGSGGSDSLIGGTSSDTLGGGGFTSTSGATGTSSTSSTTSATSTSNGIPTALGDTGTTDEDTAVKIDVLANDSDPDAGDTLSVTSPAITSGLGSVSVVGNQLVYDPAGVYDSLAVGQTAMVTVDYTVSDGHGGSATSTATLTVTGTNDGPVAVADSGSTGEDTALTLDVLANDSDPDAGDTLSVSSPTLTSGLGSVGVAGNQLVYDPAGVYDSLAVGETAIVTVDYTVSDGHGGSATATATLTVTGTNDGPVAVADSGSTGEDTALTLDVLANDSDVDASDTLTVTSPAITSGLGSVGVAGNQLVYDPAGAYDSLAVGETATVTVDYTVSDGNGGAAVATATLTVTGTNDGPLAVDDASTTGQDTALTLDVLANDSDPDASDTLTVASVTQGASGAVAINADGTVTYTPSAGYTGADSFTYSIDDGNGGTNTASVIISVGSGVTLIGTAGPDTLIGTAGDDVLDGRAGNDILYGMDGNDTLIGRAGVDIFVGGAGADFMNGSAGTDFADYSTSGAAVSIDFVLGTSTGGDAEGDTFDSVEGLIGSNFDDFLRGGNGHNNVLDGGAGNDTVIGAGSTDILIGGSGADSLDGGNGNDTADYSTSSAAVIVDLGLGTGLGGDAEGDTLTRIENLTGSDFDDTLTGEAGANVLEGGAGSDTLIGGAGIDTFVFAAGTGGDVDVIADFTSGDDTIDLTAFGLTAMSDLTIASDGGGNAIISLPGGDGIVLAGVDEATLTDADFVL